MKANMMMMTMKKSYFAFILFQVTYSEKSRSIHAGSHRNQGMGKYHQCHTSGCVYRAEGAERVGSGRSLWRQDPFLGL